MDKLHLNWSECPDWPAVRGKLRFLGTTLYGNFADAEGSADAVVMQLERDGFRVTREPYIRNSILLRIAPQ